MQQYKPQPAADGAKYRFFADPGHGWLEVYRAEVVASGAKISGYSYYDPLTDMAYLEEDCDAPNFLNAVGKTWDDVGRTLYSSAPRQFPAYDAADFIDTHMYVVRPGNGEGTR
jgi:hypothetical protein